VKAWRGDEWARPRRGLGLSHRRAIPWVTLLATSLRPNHHVGLTDCIAIVLASKAGEKAGFEAAQHLLHDPRLPALLATGPARIS